MKIFLLPFWLIGTLLLLLFSSYALFTYQNYQQRQKTIQSVELTNLYASTYSYNAIIKITPGDDIRVETLRRFLGDYNSPLHDFAEEIIRQADIYGLDYTLIPAIAFQESGGCKVIPQDSHNCWGLGIYGDKIMRFSSYPQAIEKVAKTIKETYIKKGLTNATLVEDRWTPSSRGNWSSGVNYFIGKIKEYEKNTPAS